MKEKPTALYRHFASCGTLLYVGISLSPIARLCQHRETSDWYGKIARVDVEWHPDRETALSAEMAAIRAEKPQHNIVGNGRFARVAPVAPVEIFATEPDDFPADMPWPIPARFAMIAWGLDCAGQDCAAVGVGYQPYRCKSPDWTYNYTFISGACRSKWEDFTETEMLNEVLVQYFTLTNVYEIDPRVASQALLNIQEFRDAIKAGMLGPSLMESDLPDIAKSDPRPEWRFWHSVHVFPRNAALAAAA